MSLSIATRLRRLEESFRVSVARLGASQDVPYNAFVGGIEWIEERVGETFVFRPTPLPPGLLVAFSGRGTAPEGIRSPTSYLARRFAVVLGFPEIPIVRATQVHGITAARVRNAPPGRTVEDAGACDILVTPLSSVALVVQTADCVPIVLAGARSIGVIHAGWRGAASNAAAAGVAALAEPGARPSTLHAFLGPSIRACCYEVGSEVAERFDGRFVRRSPNGRFHLDLAAVALSQLESAGVSPRNVSTHPGCTRCGGEKFASYRRDGEASGRMIALAARLPATI